MVYLNWPRQTSYNRGTWGGRLAAGNQTGLEVQLLFIHSVRAPVRDDEGPLQNGGRGR